MLCLGLDADSLQDPVSTESLFYRSQSEWIGEMTRQDRWFELLKKALTCVLHVCVPHARHRFAARRSSLSSADFWFLLVMGSRYIFGMYGMVVL